MTNAENNLVGVFENTLTESADSDINGRITTPDWLQVAHAFQLFYVTDCFRNRLFSNCVIHVTFDMTL